MRTFTRPIPVTAAIQWLESGRTNLFALVDPQTAMAIKVGKLETIEAHQKSKGRNKPWRIMSYPDIKSFHKASAPKPTNGHAVEPSPVPSPAPAVTLPKAVPAAVPVPSPVGALPATPEPHSPAVAELTRVSEQLIESIVNERIKEAVELQQAAGRGDVPTQALGLIQQVRKLEKHGLSVIAELERFNKHNPTWSHVGAVNFQQATMAMVKALTS